MTEHAPEGPKAQFPAETATGGHIQKPPSPEELDAVSKAQSMITDEWTGEPSAAEKAAPKP
jgi:hypothetical protein